MSRRATGEGSIVLRSDGRWQGSLQIAKKRRYVFGKTRAEVVEKLRALTDQAGRTGQLPTSGNLSLGQFLESWLDQSETRLRQTTLADYRVCVRKHLIPHLGHLRLSRLTPLQVASCYSALGKFLSPRRVQMIHECLRAALNVAVRWGLVGVNVATLVDAPKRTTKELTLWTPEQVACFVAAMEDHPSQYASLLVFLLASGCRISEALGLRWPDVDWNATVVKIERQLVEVRGCLVEGPPKTRSGIRSIALPSFGLAALYQQRQRQIAHRLRQGAAWPAGERVFTTEVGTPPRRANVQRAFDHACARLSIPRLRLHDLRHLHLSLLAMSGVPVKVAQQRAGHSSAQVTLKVYTHVLGDADRAAAEALGKAVTR